MSELKERKGRPSLGIYMERLNQRRWEKSFYQNRNSKTLNFFVCSDLALDILGYSSGASLMSSEVTGDRR